MKNFVSKLLKFSKLTVRTRKMYFQYYYKGMNVCAVVNLKIIFKIFYCKILQPSVIFTGNAETERVEARDGWHLLIE